MSESAWVRVSRRSRCPICDHADWCLVLSTGEVAICPRVEQGCVRDLGEAGFLHRLKEQQQPVVTVKRVAPPPPVIEWNAMQAMMSQTLLDDNADRVAEFCFGLGIDSVSMMRLGAGWSPRHLAWTFPMRDGAGAIVGIRTRTPSGKKFAITGSRNGLFIPAELGECRPLFLPEGPTSTAAMLDMGLDAIGRPFAGGGAEFVVQWLDTHPGLHVVVVADHDKPDQNGRVAGAAGAEKLARALVRKSSSVRIMETLVGKDVRDWKSAGANRSTVLAVARNAIPYTEGCKDGDLPTLEKRYCRPGGEVNVNPHKIVEDPAPRLAAENAARQAASTALARGEGA